MVLSEKHRVVFIRDFERICHGETTFERAGVVLGISPEDTCRNLDLEHGRVCVATVRISQTPYDPRYSLLFLDRGALYLHLRPWAFGEGCVRATLRRTGSSHELHATHGPSYILYVGKCKASTGPTNVQRRINERELPRWRSTPQVDLQEKLLVWALWWALLHKIGAIVLILALLFVP